MRVLLSIVYVLVLAGCTSAIKLESQEILGRYHTVVFDDGINLDEAKLIAQRELIRQKLAHVYDLTHPQTAANVADLQHADEHWFIVFNNRDIEKIDEDFIVILHKKTGRPKFAQEYNEDQRWLLEAALFRR